MFFADPNAEPCHQAAEKAVLRKIAQLLDDVGRKVAALSVIKTAETVDYPAAFLLSQTGGFILAQIAEPCHEFLEACIDIFFLTVEAKGGVTLLKRI